MNRRTFIEGAAALGLAGLVAEEAAAFASTRLTVQVRGQGPDVILIPGLTNGRAVWDGLVKALPGYRWHLVQVAGFAGDPARGNAEGQVVASVAGDIARYIAEAKLAAPAVIGHSMGGIVAMMVAARFPARVGKVMAVDILPAPAAGYGFQSSGLKPRGGRVVRRAHRQPRRPADAGTDDRRLWRLGARQRRPGGRPRDP